MLKYLFFIEVTLLSLFFLGCVKEGQEFPDQISFSFTVIDDTNAKINGAEVYFYDNEQTYNNALITNNLAGYTDSINTVASGNTVNLQGDKQYWIIVKYFDKTRNINLTNISGKLENLEKGSEVIANISIAPLDGFISFWSPSLNKFPISVSINGKTYSLGSGRNAAPMKTDTVNTVTIPLPPGNYTYYAVADNQSIWSGSINVQRNTFNPVEFPLLILGRITFVTPVIGVHGAMIVKLDNFDYLGNITSGCSYNCGTGSGLSASSGTGGYVTTTRPQGTYSYRVTSSDGLCEKTGTFTINSDTCIVINVPYCP